MATALLSRHLPKINKVCTILLYTSVRPKAIIFQVKGESQKSLSHFFFLKKLDFIGNPGKFQP
jgi:hypothetical protein